MEFRVLVNDDSIQLYSGEVTDRREDLKANLNEIHLQAHLNKTKLSAV